MCLWVLQVITCSSLRKTTLRWYITSQVQLDSNLSLIFLSFYFLYCFSHPNYCLHFGFKPVANLSFNQPSQLHLSLKYLLPSFFHSFNKYFSVSGNCKILTAPHCFLSKSSSFMLPFMNFPSLSLLLLVFMRLYSRFKAMRKNPRKFMKTAKDVAVSETPDLQQQELSWCWVKVLTGLFLPRTNIYLIKLLDLKLLAKGSGLDV